MAIDMKQPVEFTPGHISQLNDNEIFVFGSNLADQHGGGATRVAFKCFGAEIFK